MDAPKLTKRSNSDFPLGGEKLGPAWIAAWEFMEDCRWKGVRELQEVMAEASDVAPKTAYNLLNKARIMGFLEARYGLSSKNRAMLTDYRRVR